MDRNKRVTPQAETSRGVSGLNTSRTQDNSGAERPSARSNKRKQKRPSPNDNMCRGATRFDMFGSEYRWNVDGDETYRTGLGAFCTILVVIAVAIFAIFVFSRAIEVPDYSFPADTIYPNFFQDSRVEQARDRFFFAVGLSSLTNFTKNQTSTDFVNAELKFQLDYEIAGGPDDGKTFVIPLRLCNQDDLNRLADLDPQNSDVITAHM